MMNNMILALAAGVATAIPSITAAATVVQSFDLPLEFVDGFRTRVAGFDTRLGQITGVSLTYNAVYDYTLDYRSATPSTFSVRIDPGVRVTASLLAVDVQGRQTRDTLYFPQAFSASISRSRSGSINFYDEYSGSISELRALTPGETAGDVAKSPPLLLFFDQVFQDGLSLSGPSLPATYSLLNNSRISGTLIYTYDAAPVPEPATWAMMIGGMGLVGGTLRRRARGNTTVSFA